MCYRCNKWGVNHPITVLHSEVDDTQVGPFWGVWETMQLGGNYDSFFGVVKPCNVMGWKQWQLLSPLRTFFQNSIQDTIIPTKSACRRILAFTMVGEYHPKISNVFATSETSDLLVMHSVGGSSVTFTRKWSHEAFYSIPRVLVYWLECDRMTVAWESLKSVGRLSNT